jgi:hypothetical protein
MFGPGVEDAIAAYRDLPNDPTAHGLLCLIGSTDRIIHRFDVSGGVATGWDAEDAELVRVPVTEDIFERDAYDADRKTFRTNTP